MKSSYLESIEQNEVYDGEVYNYYHNYVFNLHRRVMSSQIRWYMIAH